MTTTTRTPQQLAAIGAAQDQTEQLAEIAQRLSWLLQAAPAGSLTAGQALAISDVVEAVEGLVEVVGGAQEVDSLAVSLASRFANP